LRKSLYILISGPICLALLFLNGRVMSSTSFDKDLKAGDETGAAVQLQGWASWVAVQSVTTPTATATWTPTLTATPTGTTTPTATSTPTNTSPATPTSTVVPMPYKIYLPIVSKDQVHPMWYEIYSLILKKVGH